MQNPEVGVGLGGEGTRVLFGVWFFCWGWGLFVQGLPFSFMSRFREVFRDKPCPRVGFGVGVGVGVGFGFGVGVGFGGLGWGRGWDWCIRVWVWVQSRVGVRFRFGFGFGVGVCLGTVPLTRDQDRGLCPFRSSLDSIPFGRFPVPFLD